MSDFYQCNNGLIAVKKGEKYGFVDQEGVQVIPFRYDAVLNKGNFSEGLLAVCENGKYGFIDNKGNVIIPMKYEYYVGKYICEFNNGAAPVGKDGKIVFIDKNDNELFTLCNDYVFVSGFCGDGFAYVSEKGDNNEVISGLIDKKGNLITPIEYKITGLYKEGLIAVKKGDRAQYINKSGETIIDTDYEYLGDFVNHKAVIMTSERKFGIIDIDGNISVEPRYDTLSDITDNDIVFFREGTTCGFMKTDGRCVAKFADCTDVLNNEDDIYNIEYDYGKKHTKVDLRCL